MSCCTRSIPGHARTPSSSCWTPASSTKAATSTCWWSTRRSRPKTSRSASPSTNRGPEPAVASPAADRLVSQHLVMEAATHRVRTLRRDGDAVRLDGIQYGCSLAARRRAPGVVVHGKRDQPGAPLRACRTARPTSRTRFTAMWSTATPEAVNPGRPAPRPPLATGSNWQPANRRVINLRLSRSIRSPDALRRELSTMSFAPHRAKQDEFYATIIPADLLGRCTQRHAPGVRGLALVQAVLPLRGARLD